MNREIKYLYERLNSAKKAILKEHFQASPKMLIYLELIAEHPALNTNKAVHKIYQEELETTPRPVLLNRFYKLRQKLRLWLLQQLRDHPMCLTQEEQELAFLRLLVIQNEYSYALEQLYVFEQVCWKRNLFELLPETLELILRCLRGVEQLNRQKMVAFIERQALADQLLQTFRTMKRYSNSFFDMQYMEENFKLILPKIKRLIKPYKAYPRFSIFYHYLGFVLGSLLEPAVKSNSNAIKRHLNKFKALLDEYPNIPIRLFEPYHKEKLMIHFLHAEATYWYLKSDFKASCQCLDERKVLIQKSPNLNIDIAASNLKNIILYYLVGDREEDALEYLNQFYAFVHMNGEENLDAPPLIFKVVIYARLYPRQQLEKPYDLVAEVKEYLKQIHPSQKYIYEVFAQYCLAYGFFQEARRLLEHPSLLAFLKERNLDNMSLKLLDLLEEEDVEGLQEYEKELKVCLEQRSVQNLVLHYTGLMKITANYLQKYQTQS